MWADFNFRNLVRLGNGGDEKTDTCVRFACGGVWVRHPLFASVIWGSIGWALVWQSWPSLLVVTSLMAQFSFESNPRLAMFTQETALALSSGLGFRRGIIPENRPSDWPSPTVACSENRVTGLVPMPETAG